MLSICFDAMGFSYCTIQLNKIKHKGRFWCNGESSDKQIVQMQEHMEQHPHLNQSFEKVAVIFVNRLQVLVPELFYKEEREEELLEFNAFLKDRMPLEKNDLPAFRAKLIFSYAEELEQWIKKKHGKISLFHSGTLLLCSLQAKEESMQMHLLFYPEQLDMAILKGKQLLLYNNFIYHTPEEVLYYVLFAAAQLKADVHELPVYIGGHIYVYDAVFKLLNCYLRQIKWSNYSCSFNVKTDIVHTHYHLLFSLECELSPES